MFLGLLLTACGDNATPTPAVPATVSATSTPARNSPVTIRIATGDSGDGLIPYNKIKDEFEKAHPDIKIEIQSITEGDYYAILENQIINGKGPDLLLVGDDAIAPFVKKGLLDNLTPYFNGTNGGEKLDPSIFIPSVYASGTYPFRNKPYALTKDYTSICVMYNKALFKAAGIPEPGENWTWDDFENIARKLTIKDATGKTIQYGVQLPAAWVRGFEAIAFTFGANLIGVNGGQYSGFMDSKDTLKALQLYAGLYQKDLAVPPADINKFLGGNEEFSQGKAAMQIVGRWPQAGYLKNPVLADNLGVVGLPVGTIKANAIAWSGFGINARGQHKNEAWQVLHYFGGVDGAKTWVDWGLSSVQSVSNQTRNPLDKIWADQVQYFKPIAGVYTPYWNEAGSPELQSVLVTAITDPKAGLEGLLKNAAATADKKLKAKIDAEQTPSTPTPAAAK
jgi:multiple sugar transport system substrate-binding protein